MAFECVVIAHVGSSDEAFCAHVKRLASAMPDVEFLLVADRPAAAAVIVRSQASACSNVRHLQLDVSLGKGATMRAAFNSCTAELVCFLSSNGFPRTADITACFEVLRTQPKVDAVLGSRFLPDSGYRSGHLGKTFSVLLNAVGNALFALRVKDPQSPIKVFRRAAMWRVFEDLRLYNHGFDIELLFQARRYGFSIEEIPIEWPGRAVGDPLAIGLHAVVALVLLRLAYSPLNRFAIVNMLGRRYHVPAKRSYNIMLFCWRDPQNPLAGGGEVYLHEQARYWVQLGHRVTWFAQSFPGAASSETIDGITIVRRGRFPFVFVCGALWYVFQSKRNYDFIIDCMNGIPFFTPLFSTKPKINLIYHVHSHHFRAELPGLLAQAAVFVETKLVPLVYRRTPFVTISANTRREMQEIGMSKLPISLIHSGVSRNLQPGEKSSKPTILYFGRIKRYKRIRKLVDAFQAVKRIVPDARLVIAGSGNDEDALLDYVRASGVRDVHFLGRVDDHLKVRLFQEAWVLGMPSSVEGWGIVVVEANACATPAVAYNVSGLRDCIRDGETGILAGSDHDFAAGLVRILSDSSLRERLSAGAHEWSKNFSWESTAKATLEQIRNAQPWRAVFEPAAGTEWILRPTGTLKSIVE